MRLSDFRSGIDVGEVSPSFIVRAAKGAEFALLDGKATLFSDSSQKLYALNSVAALIWCCLEEGGPQAARVRLVEAGVEWSDAAQYVDDAIGKWLQAGLLRADFLPSPRGCVRAFRVGGAHYTLETPSPDLSQQIAAVFDPRPSCAEGAAAGRFRVIEVNGALQVFLGDEWVGGCKADELAPTIKTKAIARFLARERREIVFHAACLSWRGQALLVSGAPGAGKTTLALQLAAKGFGFGGDDVAMIAPDGSAKGLALAATVKSGAWDIVGGLRPDLAQAPIHLRPDGQRVRYLAPDKFDRRAHPVGRLLFLRRESGAKVRFARLDGVEAMRRIIEGACSPARKLTRAGFGALRCMLAGAQAVELVYEHSAEAAEAIAGQCDNVA